MLMKAKHEDPETPPEINILEGNGCVTRGLCAPNYKCECTLSKDSFAVRTTLYTHWIFKMRECLNHYLRSERISVWVFSTCVVAFFAT